MRSNGVAKDVILGFEPRDPGLMGRLAKSAALTLSRRRFSKGAVATTAGLTIGFLGTLGFETPAALANGHSNYCCGSCVGCNVFPQNSPTCPVPGYPNLNCVGGNEYPPPGCTTEWQPCVKSCDYSAPFNPWCRSYESYCSP